MKTAAQLRDGETERIAGIRGATLHATELTYDGLAFMVRHVEWMDAGEKLVLTDLSEPRANYHEAVAEFHRQHESAATDHIHS